MSAVHAALGLLDVEEEASERIIFSSSQLYKLKHQLAMKLASLVSMDIQADQSARIFLQGEISSIAQLINESKEAAASQE